MELIKFFKDNIDLTMRKNADYSGSRGIWSTFDAVSKYGVSPKHGFITRMSDKIERIKSLVVENNKAKVAESVADTCADLANYCMLLAGHTLDISDLEMHATRFYRSVMNMNMPQYSLTASVSLLEVNLQDRSLESLKTIAYLSYYIQHEYNNINRQKPGGNKVEKPKRQVG